MPVGADLAPAGIVVGIVARCQHVDGYFAQIVVGFDARAKIVAATASKGDVGQDQVGRAVLLGQGQRLVDGLGKGQLIVRADHHHGKCPLNRSTIVRDQDALTHELPSVYLR